ncbi:hypothetical protein [Ensifer sp. LCM 4579]|uniref:hypothetical protein n=1 Tax=Ensifer sp. LCM 4579 TaxID=1848292 RepID=UPI0008D904CD|nr:hypothetical protein [Ensifer sp. LCM 4579]OHV80071.1 hypothetical protein LCM4579_23090 [Ensifer sp. LCM 4579]
MTTRCECLKELESQSIHSPGLVGPDEPIVYVLVESLTFENGSVKALKHERLKKSEMSVCRAQYIKGSEAKALTTDAMVANGNDRVDRGYVYALCSEIRSIGLPSLGVGAFCVVDDAFEHYPAHAHLGYSNVDDKKNDRVAARGNLLKLFQKRGISYNWSGTPFLLAS